MGIKYPINSAKAIQLFGIFLKISNTYNAFPSRNAGMRKSIDNTIIYNCFIIMRSFAGALEREETRTPPPRISYFIPYISYFPTPPRTAK